MGGLCAQEEHEVGALLLTIYLRRAGYQVQYLGKNIPIVDFAADIKRFRPALVLLSATTEETALQLAQLTQTLSNQDGQRTIIGYGGRIFQHKTTLRNQIAGIYMGNSALEAIESTNELLGSSTIPTQNSVTDTDVATRFDTEEDA
ncbi:MAG: cobalamin B12-binding domain-containing protein [Caldilineaceae bacterium]